MFFVFNQKTSYEMRISNWSSDVCSSDLYLRHSAAKRRRAGRRGHAFAVDDDRAGKAVDRGAIGAEAHPTRGDLRVGKDPGDVVDRPRGPAVGIERERQRLREIGRAHV